MPIGTSASASSSVHSMNDSTSFASNSDSGFAGSVIGRARHARLDPRRRRNARRDRRRRHGRRGRRDRRGARPARHGTPRGRRGRATRLRGARLRIGAMPTPIIVRFRLTGGAGGGALTGGIGGASAAAAGGAANRRAAATGGARPPRRAALAPRRRRAPSLPRRLDLRRLRRLGRDRQRHRRAAQRDQPPVDDAARLVHLQQRDPHHDPLDRRVARADRRRLRLRDAAAARASPPSGPQQDDEAPLRADGQRGRRGQHQRPFPGERRELLDEFVQRRAAGGDLDELLLPASPLGAAGSDRPRPGGPA